ncbi:hypothetical protein EI94DRAFT_1719740 [Lactarius quietus]|nr:hypothetical protein EI94DRAFT_1719740 [Lactarius quietus]
MSVWRPRGSLIIVRTLTRSDDLNKAKRSLRTVLSGRVQNSILNLRTIAMAMVRSFASTL